MEISQVHPGVWRLSCPWKENPTARTSEIYVVNGRKKSIVVDVAKSTIVSPEGLMSAIVSTGAHMDDLVVFLTHFHLDHSGNSDALSKRGIPILGGPREQALPPGADSREYFANLAGIPRDRRDSYVLNYLSMVYPPDEVLDRIVLAEDGLVLEADPWAFEVLHAPGHSLESCCLYERERKILFSGDTVLDGFVPPVNTTSLDCGKVEAFFSTFERLQAIDVRLTLPGHRDPLAGCEAYQDRIACMSAAHRRRIAKVENCLRCAEQGLTAYELTERYVTYEVEPGRVSPYYAVSHVSMMLGYLEHLHDTGVAERTLVGDTARYRYVPAA